jgi:hypothetical protein
MIVFLGAVLIVGGMVGLIQVAGLFPRAVRAMHTSRAAFHVINDSELADERKESLLQKYSLSLLKSFLDLSVRGAAAILIPIVALWIVDVAGILSFNAVLDLALSWPFLIGGLAASIAVSWLFER